MAPRITLSLPLEEYALIGNTKTAGLIARNGSIEWLGMPRFDSPAFFASLLGDESNGRWIISPIGKINSVSRAYIKDTLVLETRLETSDGTAAVIDFMPLSTKERESHLIRIVRGIAGKISMRSEVCLRFEYGRIKPRISTASESIVAVAAPNQIALATPVGFQCNDSIARADFVISEGQEMPFIMTWSQAHESAPKPPDPFHALSKTEAFWREWSGGYEGPAQWRDPIIRSLLTFKALTYSPTGGIVAAPTTSLPELLGGTRNWDYRFCWLRDSTFALYALLTCGYRDEALAWKEWLFRAIAAHPSQLQTAYRVDGERLLTEAEIPWLAGYGSSSPVRVGNGAYNQLQLDVFGEVADSLFVAREYELDQSDKSWELHTGVVSYLEDAWMTPDNGIWETRGGRRQHTHSKVMAWVAVDRAIRAADRFGLDGAVTRWRNLRAAIHREVCNNGFSSKRDSFVSNFDGDSLDAALLMIPLVGFLPVDDARVQGTIKAIESALIRDGFVMRNGVDEGAFVTCSFWLASVLSMSHRHREALELFERLLALRNDVGLLAEEYDCKAKRLIGNFPQTLSHVGLVNCAYHLSDSHHGGGIEHRSGTQSDRS